MRKCMFKLFALCIMFGGLIVLTSENTVTKATDNCRADYDSCLDECLNTSGGSSCRLGCFQTFSQCKEQIITDMEDVIEANNGGALPVLGEYELCMSQLNTCPLLPMDEDPMTLEDMVYCLEQRHEQKIACLSLLP